MKEENEILKEEINKMQEPFKVVSEKVAELSRKFTLQNIKEFMSPQELEDYKQVQFYFRYNEVQFKKKEKKLLDNAMKLNDENQRVKLQAQHDINEIKLENEELKRERDEYKEEVLRISEENEENKKNLKKELEFVTVLKEKFEEERNLRKKYEISWRLSHSFNLHPRC